MNARELTNRLAALLRNERRAMADFLLALAEFDRDKRWREMGHASLFAFLRRELALSAGAAQYRKTAAELIQKYPAVEAALRNGSLCLSTVIEVAKVLTPENVTETLPRFFGLSRREAEELAVSIRPVAVVPVRDVITPVRASDLGMTLRGPAVATDPAPRPPSNQELTAVLFRPAEVRPAPAPQEPDPEPSAVEATPPRTGAAPRSSVERLTGELSRLHVTVSKKFLAKLAAARDALSHSHPNATPEEILEAGLDLILAAQAKRNGLVEKPLKNPRPAKAGAYIPAHVRREVWKRDEGRCQWRFETGEICGSTYMLEVDHLHPVAHGGVATVEDCRLACFGHRGQRESGTSDGRGGTVLQRPSATTSRMRSTDTGFPRWRSKPASAARRWSSGSA
jgi:hypothetical protein